jgi:glycosyltransferase involved in cell wall biosynthesis
VNLDTSLNVTVIIPAYNAEKYIAEAIDSVLNQSIKPREIIVIDDGSTDRTYSIASLFTPSITLLSIANGGVSRARNLGMNIAKGEWVAFLDADDLWERDKLAESKAILVKNPDTKLLFSDFYIFGTESRICTCDAALKKWAHSNAFLVPLVCVLPSSAIVPRNVSVRFPEGVTDNEDAIFFNAVAELGKVQHIPKPLIRYRRHEESAQKKSGARARGCEALFRHYSSDEASLKKLLSTFVKLTESKIQGRNWEEAEFFLGYLYQWSTSYRNTPLKIRYYSILKGLFLIKDKFEYLYRKIKIFPK